MKSVSFLPLFQSSPFVLALACAHLWSELNKLAEKCPIISLQILVFCHFNPLNLVSLGSDMSQRKCQEIAGAYGWDQGQRGHRLLL